MREPPLGLDEIPHPAFDAWFYEILCASDTGTLLHGLYRHALPALHEPLDTLRWAANPLVDHPSVHIIRFALLEVDEMIAYGEKAVTPCPSQAGEETLAAWSVQLAALLSAGGELGETEPVANAKVDRMFSAQPPSYDKVPRRDERFRDHFNMGVDAEAFLYDEKMPAGVKTLMMYYKRLRESDVPEMMATIIAESPEKPWAYHVDMTRQLWDEARYAMMDEVGFIHAGIDWRKFVRVNFTWSLAPYTQLSPLERHAVLYFIEQGLMPKNGKRFEWEVGLASGDDVSALCQDFDWADEVLHTRIGRDWYVGQMGDFRKAIDYGDECWSRVLIDWQSSLDRGLTRHENWWPELYREFCRLRDERPTPIVLAFETSCAVARADLKDLSMSG